MKNPSKRATIPEIKKSEWYNGPVYNNAELRELMNDCFE